MYLKIARPVLYQDLCRNTPGLHESLQPCSRAARKWRENEEMRRKWRENEEMERDWLSTFPHSLSISSLFLHFLPLFPFPTSKCITFCCKMLNTALLSRMSQKSQHTRYEEIILGRTCCEEAPQFVPAWGPQGHPDPRCAEFRERFSKE